MVEALFVLCIWNTEYLVRCPFCVLQGLREEKKINKFVQDRKYIADYQNISQTNQ